MSSKAVATIAVASTLATIAVGCATMSLPENVPGDCSENLIVRGAEFASVAKIADRTCYATRQALKRKYGESEASYEFEGSPLVSLRVYGAGEKSKVCSNRSGTCTVRKKNGTYLVDIRKPNSFDYEREDHPPTVADKIRHEFQHIALFELATDRLEHTSEGHHKELFRLNLCRKRMCGDAQVLFKMDNQNHFR